MTTTTQPDRATALDQAHGYLRDAQAVGNPAQKTHLAYAQIYALIAIAEAIDRHTATGGAQGHADAKTYIAQVQP